MNALMYGHVRQRAGMTGRVRYVAVTDGDKVEAELKFGFSVNTYGIGDLVQVINAVKDEDIDALCAEYEKLYKVQDSLKKNGA